MPRLLGRDMDGPGPTRLEVALERLLGGRGFHMYELIEGPRDTKHWERAAAGTTLDWRWLQRESVATVNSVGDRRQASTARSL